MALIRMKNTALRRTILVVTIVPVVLVNAAYEAAKAVIELIRDAPIIFRNVWRGER